MNQVSGLSGREKLFLLGLFVFSLVLRLVYLLQIESNPFFYNPILDSLFHDLWAKSIASGDWLGEGVFFRAPFYPYFLALIYKIFGPDLFLARLIQHLIGSFSVILVYLLARKLFERKTAVISGILAATYWIFIYFEGELLLDVLLVFFDLLLLLLLYRAAEKPNFWSWFLAGLVLGLSAITRPNVLVIVPFILIWLRLYYSQSKTWLVPFKHWVYVGIAAALVILPVSIRNYIAGDDLVLIASQGGINFFIGNNPYSDGTSAVVPGLGDDWDYADAVVLAEKETGRKLKPSQASNYFYRRGWDFIFNQPQESLPLLWKKLYLFWNRIEISNNQDTYFFQRYSQLLRFLPTGFWLVGPLAILGILLALRNFRKYFLLLLFILAYMLTIVFFFVADRFRLPLLPFLMILAGSAVVHLWEILKSKAYPKLILPGLILLIAVWLCNSNLYRLSQTNFAQSYFSLGNLYLKQNQPEKAQAYYDSALVWNARLPRAHLNLGIIHLRRANLDSAGAEFAKVLGINPYEEKAYNNLSTIYRLKGEHQKAVKFARAAVELRPNYSTAYANLALAFQALNLADSAEKALKEGLKILSEDLQLHYYLGELYLRGQKFQAAQEQFQAVLASSQGLDIQTYDISAFGQNQTQTEFRLKSQAAYNLGLIWVIKEDLDRAEDYFRLALEFRPDLAQAYGNLGKISELRGDFQEAVRLYTQAINLETDNPVYYFNRAVNYANLGRIDSARVDLAECLKIDPAFQPAKKLLSQLPK